MKCYLFVVNDGLGESEEQEAEPPNESRPFCEAVPPSPTAYCRGASLVGVVVMPYSNHGISLCAHVALWAGLLAIDSVTLLRFQKAILD
jgi:hypothetical protein